MGHMACDSPSLMLAITANLSVTDDDFHLCISVEHPGFAIFIMETQQLL